MVIRRIGINWIIKPVIYTVLVLVSIAGILFVLPIFPIWLFSILLWNTGLTKYNSYWDMPFMFRIKQYSRLPMYLLNILMSTYLKF